MLKYKKVLETNSLVQYEYYPEGDTRNMGLVAISKKTGEITIIELSLKDSMKMYAMKIANKLRAFQKSSEYKENGIIAWY